MRKGLNISTDTFLNRGQISDKMAYGPKKYTLGSFSLFVMLSFMLFTNAAFAAAVDVSYTLKADILDENGASLVATHEASEQCDSYCNYTLPAFNLDHKYTIVSYRLEYPSAADYKVYFDSTNNKTTEKNDDSIIVEIIQQEQPVEAPAELICNDEQCDKGCVVCTDGKCHPPDFNCVEQLNIEKVTPTIITQGVAQINVLVRNTGSVDLSNIYLEITGDGISTIDATPIDALQSGDKDYSFVRVNATKSGTIDIIIRMYVNNKLKKKGLTQINVLQAAKTEETPAEEINATEISSGIDQLKESYMDLELEYQSKKTEGYTVDLIYDKLKETHGYIINAQSYFIEGDYKKAKANLEIAQDNIVDIGEQLKNAKKQKVGFIDKIRNNLLYISSITAAIVSIVSAYTLMRSHINKEKIINLQRKLRKAREEKGGKKRKAKKKKSKKD